jgi:hypothetical protein
LEKFERTFALLYISLNVHYYLQLTVVTHRGVTGQRAPQHVVLVNNYVTEIARNLNQLMVALIVKSLEQKLKNVFWNQFAQVNNESACCIV